MRKLMLAIAAASMLSSCQTWGPTWSEVTGATLDDIDRLSTAAPAIDRPRRRPERVPGYGGIKVEPGRARPGPARRPTSADGRGGTDARRPVMLDVAPCKRYYINAQFTTPDRARTGSRSSTTSRPSPAAPQCRQMRRERRAATMTAARRRWRPRRRRAAARRSRICASSFRRGTARCVAVHDVSFDIAPGEVLGVVGESGAGQVADRRRGHRPHRSAGPHRRRAKSGLPGRRIDNLPYERDAHDPRPRDRRRVPGSADLAQSAVHGRPAAGRDDPHASAAERSGGARAGDRAARRSGHSRGGAPHRPLSAPVLGRHAAARRDRAGAGGEAASSSSPTSRRPRSTCRSRRRSSSC